MKKSTFLIVLLVIYGCNSKQPVAYDMVITNINLIDGTGNELQKEMSIGVKEGKIVAIEKELTEKGKQHIDGTHKYLIPGLFDCHIHTENYERDFPLFIHYGVTSVFITGGSLCTNDYYAKMRQRGNQDSIPAPRVFHTSQHFSMEGRHPSKTYASPNWRDGESIFFLKDTLQIEGLVQRVAKQPIAGIKLTIEDGPAPPFVDRIPQEFIDKTVSEASKHGLEVFAHASDNDEFLMAVNGGVQNLVHFVGIDIDWDNEEHLSAVDALLNRNASIVTTLVIDKSFLYPLNPEWLDSPALNEGYSSDSLKKLITPEAIARANRISELTKIDYGLDEISIGKIFLPKVEDIQKLIDKGMNLTLGTDAGNSFNFHGYSLHEEMQLLQMGGMQPMEILKMGTLNAAKMLKVDEELGSIEVGKIADMVLLDKNPLEAVKNTLAIHTVIKNGKVQKRISNGQKFK
ncbi:MAG: amidohydrolase family protein [Saonia sp.]